MNAEWREAWRAQKLKPGAPWICFYGTPSSKKKRPRDTSEINSSRGRILRCWGWVVMWGLQRDPETSPNPLHLHSVGASQKGVHQAAWVTLGRVGCLPTHPPCGSSLYSVVAAAKPSQPLSYRLAFKIEVSCETANNSLLRVLKMFTGT